MKRVHYAWVVAAVTFIALMGAAGFRATPSVLIVPLQNEFGWNRAVISGAVSVNLVLYGLIGPFAAAVMDRLQKAWRIVPHETFKLRHVLARVDKNGTADAG